MHDLKSRGYLPGNGLPSQVVAMPTLSSDKTTFHNRSTFVRGTGCNKADLSGGVDVSIPAPCFCCSLNDMSFALRTSDSLQLEVSGMKLRDHPLLSYKGGSSWPPKWLWGSPWPQKTSRSKKKKGGFLACLTPPNWMIVTSFTGTKPHCFKASKLSA